MSIDVNDYIQAALSDIGEQINEVHDHMPKVLKAYWGGTAFSETMEQLEQLLRSVSDSVEIFQNYNGQYDRVNRHCWGDHPCCYEVQCRLCAVQRLCSEETAKRNTDRDDLPACFNQNPLLPHSKCWDCSLFRLCLKETRNQETQL
jgi:hypothetical protein